MDTMIIEKALKWRYATKKFDSQKLLSEDVWASLKESLVLSPSSLGLQLWQFIDVKTPALREKLRAVSWDQSQVTDASKLLVFTVRRDFKSEDMERHLMNICRVRGLGRESQDAYAGRIIGLLGARTPEQLESWMVHQVYIALGVIMTSAAMLNVDTCPMEGLEPLEYDAILGLNGTPYRTVLVLALGYRSLEDTYALLNKVRYSEEELIIVR